MTGTAPPARQPDAPRADDSAAQVRPSHSPPGRSGPPPTQGAPHVHGGVPQSQGHGSPTRAGGPRNQAKAPQPPEGSPRTRGAAPRPEDGAPKTTGGARRKKARTPKAKRSRPANRDGPRPRHPKAGVPHPRRKRTRGRIGLFLPVGPGRVAMWQLAVLAVLATGLRPGPVAIAVWVAAAALLAMTSLRVGGLCGYQWMAVFARFTLRRRHPAPPDPTPVHALVPRLRVHQHEDRVGNRTGIASSGDDHIAVVRLAPAAHPDPALLVSLLHRAISRDEYPVSSARLVILAVPASPWPVRMHWLALRYRAADAPWAALARGGGVTGCRKAVAGATQRLLCDLADAGCTASVLDAPELCQELLVALNVSPDPGHRPVETWRHWSTGPVRQACFTPRDPADAVPLLGRSVAEATFTCTAHSLTPTTATTTVRLGVAGQKFWLTPERVAAKLGVRLLPANGRQAASVLSTLPIP